MHTLQTSLRHPLLAEVRMGAVWATFAPFNLGLECFGALRRLDMQALCDNDLGHGWALDMSRDMEWEERLPFRTPVIRQLAPLSASLQELRVALYEGWGESEVWPLCMQSSWRSCAQWDIQIYKTLTSRMMLCSPQR